MSPTPSHHSRLILILSSERSGSTLLRVILGNHSRIISPSELWLLNYETYREWRERKPLAIESLREYLNVIGLSKPVAEVDAMFAGGSAIDAYKWMLSLLPPESIFVDKTPGYSNSLATLRRADAFAPLYIWLIRHPLGVIDSHTKLKRKRHSGWSVRDVRWRLANRLDWLRHGSMTSSARSREAKWVAQNRNIETFLERVPAERWATIHFEQLVRNPKETVAALCRRLGVALESPMLAPVEARPMGKGLGDPNFHGHSRIESETAERWRETFSESDLAPETLELMRHLRVGGM